MVPWVERPTVELDLARPLTERLRGVPAEAYAAGRKLLDTMLAHAPASIRMLADWVRLRTANRFHDEAMAIATETGVSWREIILANVSYDLVLAGIGCSTVALATPDGPVVARNMDWWPEGILARTSYLLRCTESGRLRFANAGWPGAIGVVTGMSGRGFAVVLNAVRCVEGVNQMGYPVLLHLRRVVEDARDFKEALTMLSEENLAAAGLFTLVGTRNDQRVVIERTPTRHALRWPEGDEPLITTNHYRLLSESQEEGDDVLYRTTCYRHDALARFFRGHRADRHIDDTGLLYALSEPSVIQGITAQHIVMRPGSGGIRLFVPRRLVEDRRESA